MRTLAAAASATRAARKEGSIADIFTSLTDESHVALPDRFVDVKRALWNDGLVESWRQVLEALEPAVENIAAKGSDVWSSSSLSKLTLITLLYFRSYLASVMQN